MPHSDDAISALIGSRICHDLISPIGAVANGLELLELSGIPNSPELALTVQSARNASARVRFFRLAFGHSDPDQSIGEEDVRDILRSVFDDGRTRVAWKSPPEMPRSDAKMALLGVLCAESALPLGGEIAVHGTAEGWNIQAGGPRLSIDDSLWSSLTGKTDTDLPASAVQFLLLPRQAREVNRTVTAQITDDRLRIDF